MLTGLLALGQLARRRAWPRRVAAASHVTAGPTGAELDESDAVLDEARAAFHRLQAAWHAADLETLARLTSAPLCRDLCEQLHARGPAPGAAAEFVDLQVRLVGFDRVAAARLARVEFRGRMRACPGQDVCEFRELWWLARLETPPAIEGTAMAPAWQVARVLALD